MRHLAAAALERGDEEWENIQDVIRDAFLVHAGQLKLHEEKLHACERRANDLTEKWTGSSEQVAKLQGLSSHVDKLARVVNTLSEELKQRAHADHERQQQQAKWMDSVSRTVGTQLHTLHARVANDVESACAKALASLERRMTLMEEELSHLVTALDQKADIDTLKTHKQAFDEALKQRCRKAAFDKEVVRVHQMVRSQHTTMSQRMEDIQNALQKQIEQYVSNQEQVQQRQTATEAGVSQRFDRLRQEIMTAMTDKIKTVEEVAALNTAAEIATVQEIVMHHVTELVVEKGDELRRLLREIDVREKMMAMEHEWQEWSQRLTAANGESANDEVVSKINTLREEVTVSLTNTTDRLARWEQQHVDDRERREKLFTDLQEQLTKLQTQLDQAAESIKQQAERFDNFKIEHENQQATLGDELRDLAKLRDKKARQQMHLVADKLREMDQILKLVGKQLVQNTSQLQLLWIDQHDATESLLGDVNDIRLLESDRGDASDAGPMDPLSTDAMDTRMPAEEATDATLRSRHEQLQQSIAAKLRDYETVLATKDAPNGDPQQDTNTI